MTFKHLKKKKKEEETSYQLVALWLNCYYEMSHHGKKHDWVLLVSFTSAG